MDQQQQLSRQLHSRHIMMIALGGAIGAGIFKGSSSSIGMAGPGVVLSYLVGGLILYIVMNGLAEMAIDQPHARNFRDLIATQLGDFIGYSSGWFYWLSWVLVMAAEMAAAAVFLQYWLPNVPLWLLSLILSILITVLNLFQVNIYGETEYWLAAVKVAVLTLFILLGGALIFIGINGQAAPGFTNLTSHGGFLPFGFSGLAASMLVVMFSFGGTEMVGMTLGETKNPEKVIPKAARNVITRVLLFYVLPILIIVSLTPWNQIAASSESPFVNVFSSMGIRYVGGFMNFVLLTAVISAANTGMYAASRMLFTQAQEGQAPRSFARLSARNVPVRALLASTVFLYIGVIIAFFAKGKTFDYLMVLPGYAVLTIWILLSIAYFNSRRKKGLSTLSPLFALLVLLVILVGILYTSPLVGSLTTGAAVLLIAITYLIQKKA